MPIDPSAQAIAAYASQAEVLRSRYDDVSSDDVLSAVRDLVPQEPMRVLDIGAGSRRDAVWFAARGHKVTAAEPVAEFRAVIARRLPNATTVDARLPDLDNITGPFGLILANAVWQHLTAEERVAAFARMSGLLGTAGRLILSLRHGSLLPGQPVFTLDPEEEVARAVEAGLALCRRISAPSHQPQNAVADVTWTWLVFEKEAMR